MTKASSVPDPLLVKRVRILIADDHTMIREGFKALIETQPDLEWIAEAGDGETAVRLAQQFEPDVIVMDLRMPKIDGFAATREIMQMQPNVAILVMSSSDDSGSVMRALQAGARGYITKDSAHRQVLSAIRSVAQGGMVFGDAVAPQVLESFRQPVPASMPERVLGRAAFAELTDREFEVLELLARGLRNREIAAALNVSDKTVRNHVSNILWKLQATNRDEVVMLAHQAGLAGAAPLSTPIPLPKALKIAWAAVPRPPAGLPSLESSQLVTRFVGRKRALAQLEAAWNKGQAILITGEPGMGKSRLLREFLADRGQTIFSPSRPDEFNLPYAAYRHLLRQLQGDFPLEQLPGWVSYEVSRVLPEIADGQINDNPIGNKLRFFEAVSEFVRLCGPQLAAVAKDDIHFLDPVSFELGAFLAPQFALHNPYRNGPAVRSISCYRQNEIPAKYEAAIRSVAEMGQAAIIELEPLSVDEVRGLLVHFELPSVNLEPLRAQLEARAEELHRFTGGNPLFVIETVKSLLESDQLGEPGVFALQARDGLPRAPRVKEVLKRRLDRLSRTARDVSRVAAILGQAFTPHLSALMLEIKPLQVGEALEELESTGILRAGQFSHDLLLENTLEETPTATRKLLHAAALEVLEREGALGGVLARHALEADDDLAAFKYSLLAGDQARAVYAYQEAVVHHEHAWKIGGDRPGFPAREIERLHVNLADSLEHLTQFARAEELHQEAIRLGQALVSPAMQTRAWIALGRFSLLRKYDTQTAEANFKEAQRIMGNDLGLQLELSTALALLSNYQGDFAGQLEQDLEGLRLAQQLERPDLIAEKHYTISAAYACLDRWAECETQALEGAEVAIQAGLRTFETSNLFFASYAQSQTGRAQIGFLTAQKALEIAREIRNPFVLGQVHFAASLASNELGDHARALEHAHESVRQQRQTQDIAWLIFALIARTAAALASAQFEQARTDLQEIEAMQGGSISPKSPLGLSLLTLHDWWCSLFALEGNWGEAGKHALEAFKVQGQTGCFHMHASVPRRLKTEALLRNGHEIEAHEDLEILTTHAGENQRFRLIWLRSQAGVDRFNGQVQAALQHTQAALELAVDLGLQMEIGQLERQQSELEAQAGLAPMMGHEMQDELTSRLPQA